MESITQAKPDDPFVEAHAARIAGRIRLSGADVKLAEDAGPVAGRTEGFRQGLLMGTKVVAVVRNLLAQVR
ncbi:MAG TPA: hypothetical protein VJ952_09140 [Opitutales bacterium]|nr:hypothetical protein [Opitutales bacterium]